MSFINQSCLTCLVINAWNKNKITFVMRDLNFYSVLIKEEILHLQVWFSNLIHQNLSRGMIPKHFLSSNGSKIESKFRAKIPIGIRQMGLKAIKWWNGTFYLLCFSNFVKKKNWVGKHGLWCMLYVVWNCAIQNSKMALIKYEFHNTTSVCLKIRMTGYIVYESFHWYVKSKLYY